MADRAPLPAWLAAPIDFYAADLRRWACELLARIARYPKEKPNA